MSDRGVESRVSAERIEPRREHGGLVMDLFVALNEGDYLAADDTDFIENVALALWNLGWRPRVAAGADLESRSAHAENLAQCLRGLMKETGADRFPDDDPNQPGAVYLARLALAAYEESTRARVVLGDDEAPENSQKTSYSAGDDDAPDH